MIRVALAGSPNCGKTALFNALTGSRHKVANFAGVTVEKKTGVITTPRDKKIEMIDLPGVYSLNAKTLDEEITRDVLLGKIKGESVPNLILAVCDATNLERGLSLVLELKAQGIPMALSLNMMDLASARGQVIDLDILSRELEIPVIPTVAIKHMGVGHLIKWIDEEEKQTTIGPKNETSTRERFKEVDRILKLAVKKKASLTVWTDRIDSFVLHPIFGSLLLATVLFLMFQAVFIWASFPASLIKEGFEKLSVFIGAYFPETFLGGALKSLVVDGVIAGVGGVLVFLPQILLLFLFILLLEDSGYMARAAFLMDRIMGSVGLNGKAFIPLLSSYACAIPGIMATRTIEDKKDRLTTILVAPLTTCSARIPVYTLLISAFIANPRTQGLVMFSLYVIGLAIALSMAALLKNTVFRAKKPALIMELPTYKWPSLKNIFIGLYERAMIFVRRAGTVILTLSVLVWFLSSYPKPPLDASPATPAINYSFAGRIGHTIEPLIKPLGFDWRIGIALIPGFAAREVMVSALSTVYAIETKDKDEATKELGENLRRQWSLGTALALLAWYVVALQCLSTVAVARRETNSWKYPAIMLGYLTVLAYIAAYITYRASVWMHWA